MFSLSYTKLFDLDIRNNYYTNGKTGKSASGTGANDFTLHPVCNTSEIMKRMGMIPVMHNNSMRLFISADKNKNTPVRQPLAGDKLIFFIDLINTELPGFSDLPDRTGQKIFYFTNRLASLSTELCLHKSEVAGSEDMLKLEEPFFSYMHSGILNPEMVFLLLEENGTKTFPVRTSKQLNNISKADFELDKNPAGRYAVWISGESSPRAEFYFAGDTKWDHPFAILEIFFGNNVPDAYMLIDENDGTIHPRDYVVQYDNRAAYWRYHVIKTRNNIEDMNITPGSNSFSFTQSHFSDSFISDVPIEIREEKHSGIELNYRIGSNIFQKNNLPNPHPLHIWEDADGKSYADIYLTI